MIPECDTQHDWNVLPFLKDEHAQQPVMQIVHNCKLTQTGSNICIYTWQHDMSGSQGIELACAWTRDRDCLSFGHT